MKLTKTQKIYAIISICILALSVLFTILDATAFKEWIHPAFMFFGIIALGFGVLTLYVGIKDKKPFVLFISAILFTYLLVYLLCQFTELAVYIIVICGVALALAFGIAGITILGNKTEYAKNTEPDYKGFEERQAEKDAKNKEELEEAEANKPTIKRFDD